MGAVEARERSRALGVCAGVKALAARSLRRGWPRRTSFAWRMRCMAGRRVNSAAKAGKPPATTAGRGPRATIRPAFAPRTAASLCRSLPNAADVPELGASNGAGRETRSTEDGTIAPDNDNNIAGRAIPFGRRLHAMLQPPAAHSALAPGWNRKTHRRFGGDGEPEQYPLTSAPRRTRVNMQLTDPSVVAAGSEEMLCKISSSVATALQPSGHGETQETNSATC